MSAPLPVQQARPAHGCRPPAIGQSPSGKVNGDPVKISVASRSGVSCTTRTGKCVQQRPSFSTSRRVMISPSVHTARDGTKAALGFCEMDVSVVVTVLNEEGSVGELHRRLAASL